MRSDGYYQDENLLLGDVLPSTVRGRSSANGTESHTPPTSECRVLQTVYRALRSKFHWTDRRLKLEEDLRAIIQDDLVDIFVPTFPR